MKAPSGRLHSQMLHLGICLLVLIPHCAMGWGWGWLSVSSIALPSGKILQYSLMSFNSHSTFCAMIPPCFETREAKPRDLDAGPNSESSLVAELKIKYRTYDRDVNLSKSQPWAQGRFMQLFCVLWGFFALVLKYSSKRSQAWMSMWYQIDERLDVRARLSHSFILCLLLEAAIDQKKEN